MNSERWLPVLGYGGTYEVSDLGHVRSVDRDITTKGGVTKVHKGRVLVQFLDGSGYPTVSLCRASVCVSTKVHRLVMLAFDPPASTLAVEVNHKSGVKTDNRRANLEWVTHSENMTHSVHILGNPVPLVKFGANNPSALPVERVGVDGSVVRYATAVSAAPEGFYPDAITRCCRGKLRSHHGFVWRYADASRAVQFPYVGRPRA